MRHITIAEYGTFLGLKSERILIRSNDTDIREIALRDIRTIKIAKSGVSISSDLIFECSSRGIKIFFTNFKGEVVSSISGTSQHAVAKIRREQFRKIDSDVAKNVAVSTVISKIKNQRAVLLYFNKYLKKKNASNYNLIDNLADDLKNIVYQLKEFNTNSANWRSKLMGLEGSAASLYFSSWPLLGVNLESRKGRGAVDIVNSSLNYGYAILQSHVWTAVINAGLEPYVGFLHVDRPGKPSLVLDLMEEYRPWVVDRIIIKILSGGHEGIFDSVLRKKIINEIEQVVSTKIVYLGKKLRLETIIQRRAYRLAGVFMEETKYPPFIVKW